MDSCLGGLAFLSAGKAQVDLFEPPPIFKLLGKFLFAIATQKKLPPKYFSISLGK
jgi:hypothetical protein